MASSAALASETQATQWRLQGDRQRLLEEAPVGLQPAMERQRYLELLGWD